MYFGGSESSVCGVYIHSSRVSGFTGTSVTASCYLDVQW